jgi:hypothetical protein
MGAGEGAELLRGKVSGLRRGRAFGKSAEGIAGKREVEEAEPITRCEAVRSPQVLSAMRWSVETVFDSEEHILHWIGRLPGPTELR